MGISTVIHRLRINGKVRLKAPSLPSYARHRGMLRERLGILPLFATCVKYVFVLG